MRPERPESTRQSPPAAGPYVLNLCTAATPQALREVERADLQRFTFFTSRSQEGGRVRFRLHMGYFATLEEARPWLKSLRDDYPAAWVGPAPGRETPLPPRRPVPRAPLPADSGSASGVRPPSVPALPVARPVAPPTVAHFLINEDLIPSLPPQSPPVLRPWPGSEPGLSGSGVLRVLTSPPDDADSAFPSARDTGTRRALREERIHREPEYFAVELVSSNDPVEIEEVPPLPILDQYTLYTVEGQHEGAIWYAMRLGFFTDAAFARQVADQVVNDFVHVTIVRVSGEEKRAALGEESDLERLPPPGIEEAELVFSPVPELVDAQEGVDGEEAGGQYAGLEAFLSQGARRRRLQKSQPFFRLLEMLGERIKGQ